MERRWRIEVERAVKLVFVKRIIVVMRDGRTRVGIRRGERGQHFGRRFLKRANARCIKQLCD